MSRSILSKISLYKIQTPCYLLDLDSISKRYNELISIWKKYHSNSQIAYSYKTNSLQVITQTLKKNKSLAEVVSGQELDYAILDGFKTSQIIFNGSVKLENELIQAIKFGVLIQVDSLFELEQIIKISNQLKIIPKLGIRLAHKIEKTTSRFGIQESDFVKCADLIRKHQMNVLGLHLHCGSNILDATQYLLNFEMLNRFKSQLDIEKFSYLNIGGGFPANSSGKKIDLKTYEQFAKKIVRSLQLNKLLSQKTLLLTEPGRSIVEDFGYLISKVLFQKIVDGKNKLITDTSITQMSSVRFWKHDVSIVGNETSKKSFTYDIHGFNCFESDTIGKGIKSNSIPEFVIVNNCGGYDIPSNSIWTRSLPTIYVIEKDILYKLKSHSNKKELYRQNYLTQKQKVK